MKRAGYVLGFAAVSWKMYRRGKGGRLGAYPVVFGQCIRLGNHYCACRRSLIS